MSEWKEYRLGDILSIKSGFSYQGKFIGTGNSLLLGMGCVSFKEKFLMSGARPYSGPYDERYKVHSGDIVLATRQQSDNLPILAMPAMVPDSLKDKDIVIGTNLYKVEITDTTFSSVFIYWLLKTKRYVNYIAGVKTGTTVSMVTKKNVEDFTFFAPTDPKEREEIASIISSLDDKIAVNKKICENLEAQAQALFKHWFVDFAPFKDGKFVESELGLIPEGWRVGTLGDIAEFKRGKTITKSDVKEGLIPVVAGGLEPAYYHNQSNTSSRVITISGSGANAGFTRMYYQPVWASDCSYVDNATTSFLHTAYCYLLTNKKKVDALQWGAAQPHVYAKDINKLPLVIAPLDVLNHFEELISGMFDLIEVNDKETLRLAFLRDTLLPKLMSGQIKL